MLQRHAYGGRSAVHLKLAQHITDVKVHCRTRQHQAIGYVGVAESFDHQCEHFALSLGQCLSRYWGRGRLPHQRLGRFWPQGGSAHRGRTNCIAQSGHSYVLEQVADCSSAQHLRNQVILMRARHRDHLGLRMCLPNGKGRPDSIELWQFKVHQHHVRPGLSANTNCLGSSCRLTYQLQILRGFQESRQAAADHEMVVDDYHSNTLGHGRSPAGCGSLQTTRKRVPWPGSLSIDNRALIDSDRSRMISTPRCPAEIDAGSKPRPSSETESCTPSTCLTRWTSA